MQRVLAAAAALATLVAGCGTPKASTTELAKASPTTVQRSASLAQEAVTTRDGRMSLQLPKGWIRASKSDPEFKKIAEKHSRSDAIRMIEALADNEMIQLMAFDQAGIEKQSRFVSNINVVRLPALQSVKGRDMKLVAEEAAKGLSLGPDPRTSVLETPNGKVGKYSGSTTVGSGSDHDLIGGVLVHGEHMYTVTLSASTGQGKRLSAVFDEIMRSIKFR